MALLGARIEEGMVLYLDALCLPGPPAAAVRPHGRPHPLETV
jgi:hypothetical protein